MMILSVEQPFGKPTRRFCTDSVCKARDLALREHNAHLTTLPSLMVSRAMSRRKATNMLTKFQLVLAACLLVFGQAGFSCLFGQERTRELKEQQDESLFSGPQPGETLPAFTVRMALGSSAGEEVDFVAKANGKPLLLVFVHDVNRQSISFARILSGYAIQRAKDGLATGVIFLDDDASSAELLVKRIQHALTSEAPTAISLDGREGPGALGLNRKVMMTILVANENKVQSNFALIQPSLQADLPKVLKAIVDVVGGEVPKLESLEGMPRMQEASAEKKEVPDMRPLLSPLIRRDASDEDVDRAAALINEKASADQAIRSELARIAKTIVDSGKLSNYGTARAQEYLQRWAVELNQDAKDSPPGKDPAANERDKPRR
jgi:hypothetical protein